MKPVLLLVKLHWEDVQSAFVQYISFHTHSASKCIPKSTYQSLTGLAKFAAGRLRRFRNAAPPIVILRKL